MSFPSPVIISATARHTATVIFLHGLGDTGHGWSYAFNTIAKKSPHVKYICPSANSLKVTLNGGCEMPAWFDIKTLSVNKGEDEKGIKESALYVQSLIEKEKELGIAPNRIVVGGFSQGGAVALYASLTSKVSLAGVLVLSAWLPMHKSFPADLKEENKNTPILQCHGEADPVVNYQYGQMTDEALTKMCTKHKFNAYPGLGHSSSEQELSDVRDWLTHVLPPLK